MSKYNFGSSGKGITVQDPKARMSDYERHAWGRLINEASASEEEKSTRLHQVAGRIRATAKVQAEKSKKAVMSLPRAEDAAATLNQAMESAMKGLHVVTVDFGLNSVSEKKVVARFQKKGHDIERLDDIRALDLRACDKVVSQGKQTYMVAGVIEGTATSVAVTGLTVSASVTGGVTAGVAAGAIAVDVTTVLVGMGRIIADVAAHYGYDVTEPEEAVVAAGVLSYSTASGSSQKAAALSSLSKLTQSMMRRTTMRELSKNQIVRVIEAVFRSIGIRMTRRKLAQAVPVAGVLINSGLNAKFVHDTYSRAHLFYRLRFLTEKYGLDSAEWMKTGQSSPEGASEVVEDIVLVDEVVAAAIEKNKLTSSFES